MHKLYIRQVYQTRKDIVEPDPEWSSRTIRVWQCIELDFVPMLGAHLSGPMTKGIVTNIEQSFTSLGNTYHKIDLDDMQPSEYQLSEVDMKTLLGNKERGFPQSFNGGFIIEMWE